MDDDQEPQPIDSSDFGGGSRTVSRAASRAASTSSAYPGGPRAQSALSSYHNHTRTASPVRNLSDPPGRRSALSAMPSSGSIHRLTNIFKTRGNRHASMSQSSVYETSDAADSIEDMRHEMERQEEENDQMENVRACCDGKHFFGAGSAMVHLLM